MVRGVAVEGRSLDRGGEPGRGGVDLRGGAQDPETGQSLFIREKEIKRREAGLNGQDAGGGAYEAVRCPPLDLVPENGELSCHVTRG